MSEDTEFGYDGPGDSPSYAVDGTVTSYMQGPGGLLRSSRLGLPSYPLANGHGDIVGTTDAAGVFQSTPTTDEFGRGDPPPDRLGWLGSHQRYSTGGDLKLVRMGVRLYDPALGRFLQVDPVEGGCANDYTYVFGDPVNSLDLDGRGACQNGVVEAFIQNTSALAALESAKAFGQYVAQEAGTRYVSSRLSRSQRAKVRQLGRLVAKGNVALTIVGTAADIFCQVQELRSSASYQRGPGGRYPSGSKHSPYVDSAGVPMPPNYVRH